MKNKLFHTGICILLLFSVFVFPVAETTATVSAADDVEKYIIALDTDHGTFIDYDESYDIYFQPGEPLKLPKVKKKGYVFCGWTTKPISNLAWFTITGENTKNLWGSTYNWHEPKKLYAQFVKITTKKLGKRKLKVILSKWVTGYQLEIQYSTNKKFRNAKSIIIEGLMAPIDQKNYFLKYRKGTLSLTLSKLKTKKKYYFRFQFSSLGVEFPNEEYADVIGDWFQKSVKM